MVKFKVGDKVKIKNWGPWTEGYIVDLGNFGDYYYVSSVPKPVVKLHSNNGSNFYYCILGKDLESVPLKPLQSHIDEVMDEFDFAKVEQVMQALDWKWWSAVEGIPTQGEMRRQVRRLMKDTYERADKYDEDELYTATGGFEVTYSKKHDTFRVSFRVTDWMTNEFQSEPPF